MIFLDFETQSIVDLKKTNSRKYAVDPSTRIALLASIGEKKLLYAPYAPKFSAPEGWTLTEDPLLYGTLCAHNAMNFDKLIWDKHFPKREWKDTLYLCRAAGLPGSLEKVSQSLFNEGKDKNGANLINLLCKAKIKGDSFEYPVTTSTAWSAFAEYCCKDVELLSRLYPLVAPYEEADIIHTHDAINERGIPIDVPFAARICLLQEELTLKKADEFADLSGLNPIDIRSVKKVTNWLQQLGVQLPVKNGKPTLDRKELSKFFEENEDNDELSIAIQALKARIEVTRVTKGKALAMLKAVDTNGRACGQHVYYGAHTGRWSGREIQPHNFPRSKTNLGLCKDDLTLEELGPNPSETLSGLLRPVIHSQNLAIADYASIEARGVSWLSGDSLENFSHPDADPYLPLASRIFNREITKADESERWVGKQAILGAGYGMSWRKFDLYCKVQNVNLEKMGLDPKHIIDTYRQTHPAVVESWKQFHNAAFAALEGHEIHVCRCVLYTEDKNLVLKLPAGRKIVYRNVRIEPRRPAYMDRDIPSVVYDHPHGYPSVLYGGKLIENAVQAVCRDLLAESLVKVEKAGLRPIMHVHDEIICEEKLDDLLIIMATRPEWAQDFPILVEGFESPRYVKGKVTRRSMNGMFV